MKCNSDGREIIKKYEGLRLKAYKCPVGKLTIGYGHTIGVKDGMVITEKTAEDILDYDIQQAEMKVIKHIKTYELLNENQFSALVSFMFNIKETSFAASNTKQLFNNGKIEEGGKALLKWCFGKVNNRDVKLDGLVKRRQSEYELFNKPVGEKNG